MGLMFSATLDESQMTRAKVMLILLITNFALSFPLSIFSSIMQAYERFIFIRTIDIVRLLVSPVIVIPLLYIGYGSIMMVVISVILNILCLLFNVYYCFRYLNVKFQRGKYESVFLLEIAGYSFFIFLNAIMDKVYWGTGQFVLGIVSGTVEVAIYAIAMQFMMMYMQFSSAISGLLLPKVTMMVANNVSSRELTNLMIKVGRLQFIIVGYIFLAFILLGKDFLCLWAGDNYLSAYPIVLILMLAMVIPLLQNSGIAILQAKNLNKYRMTVYTIAAILDVIFCIPMVKYFGGIGCAATTAIALIVSTGLIMNIYYKKKIKIDITLFWENIFSMSWSFIIIFAAGIYFNVAYPIKYSWTEFFIKAVVCTLLYFCIIYIRGMNNYEKNICYSVLRRIKQVF